MRSSLGLLSLLFLVFGLNVCAPAVEPSEGVPEEVATTEADAAAMESLRAKYVAAYNAEDVDGLVSLFTDDAIRMLPDEPAISGAEELRADFGRRFEETDAEVSVATDEIEVAGDWAFTCGTFSVTATPAAGGEPMQYTGKWINIMQRQVDDSWKISHNIYNSDVPVTPTGE